MNSGSSTALAEAASPNRLVHNAFMWYSGAANNSRWCASGQPRFIRCSSAQRCPAWLSGTPLGRPVEPEVYSTMAISSSPGATGSKFPASRNAAKPPSPARSKFVKGISVLSASRRGLSQKKYFTSESARMKSTMGGGNLWFTGTATSPALRIPR